VDLNMSPKDDKNKHIADTKFEYVKGNIPTTYQFPLFVTENKPLASG
jgi:hypothetical protein